MPPRRSATGQFLPATAVRRGGTSLVVVPSGRPARRTSRSGPSPAARAAAYAAREEKHTLAALGSSLVLGLARRTDTQLPTVGNIPPPLLYGLAAWGVGRFMKNKTAAHMATGILSVGLYESIAYTRETRDQIDDLIRVQAESSRADEGEVETLGRGIVGDIGD